MIVVFKSLKQFVFLTALFAVGFFFFVGCFDNQQQNNKENQTPLKARVEPPVKILAKKAKPVLIDTCPVPVRIFIPAKLNDSKTVQIKYLVKTIRTSPPVSRPANFAFNMQNYNVEQGLAQGTVSSSVEDHLGNLWFGTGGEGVSCYDGKSFTNFTIAQGLVNGIIISMAEDKTGNMWFGSGGGGACRYDGKSFVNFTSSEGLVDNTVRCITADKRGNIWFGTGGGISKFDGKSIRNYTTSQGLLSNIIINITEDKLGNLWFCTDGGGVCRYDGKSFVNFTKSDGLVSNSIFSSTLDKSGNIWFGSSLGGISYFNGKSFTTIPTPKEIATYVITGLQADKMGNIWICTNGAGVFYFDGQSFTSITTKQGLANNYVFNCIEDRNGNMWFNTLGGGVSRYDGRSFAGLTAAHESANAVIFNIKADRSGRLWFATYGEGICCYDGNSFIYYTTSQGLANNNVYCSTPDKTGGLWFGTNWGLSHYDGQSFTNFTTAQGMVSNTVTYLMQDKKENLWIGTRDGGVSCYDGKSFTDFTTKQGLANNIISCIIEDRTGAIWFGTYGGGLSKYDGKSFANFTTAQGLANNFLWCGLEDRNGNLWFGTDGKGVSRYDGKSFLTFSANEGLPNNVINSMVQDKQGNIWLGTNVGFTKIKFTRAESKNTEGLMDKQAILGDNGLTNQELEKYKPVFETYSYKNGYPIKDINSNAMFCDSNGTLWAGSEDKILRFDCGRILRNLDGPRVVIKKIQIDGQNISWQDLSLKSQNVNCEFPQLKKNDSSIPVNVVEELAVFGIVLTQEERAALRAKFDKVVFDSVAPFYSVPQSLILPYEHNSITFEFNAIEPAKPYLINYQYMLEGYSKDWSSITKKTSATFGNMYEGTYTFKLKAQSPDGIWSEALTYTFKVLPPWYRTWWMFLSYIICSLLVLVSIFRWLTNRLKLEKQVLEFEQKALRAQMNPHFIFNSMNSIQSYISENDSVTAEIFLSRFARLIRNILSSSSKLFVLLSDEIKVMEDYLELERLQFNNKFDFSFHIAEGIETENVEIPSMLIQPYLENAILHGLASKAEKGNIRTSFLLGKNGFLICEIEDNGIGRVKAKEIKNKKGIAHQSVAMSLTKERLEILNRQNRMVVSVSIIDLSDENNEPCGTKIVLTIPYREIT